MTTPINLYFDLVTKGKHGQTIDLKKIMYNLGKIDKQWLDIYLEMVANASKASLVIPAGKFVCLVTMTIEEGSQGAMILMDWLNNEEIAKHYAEEAKAHGQSREFMHTFYKIRNNKKDWGKFKLVQGDIPVKKDSE